MERGFVLVRTINFASIPAVRRFILRPSLLLFSSLAALTLAPRTVPAQTNDPTPRPAGNRVFPRQSKWDTGLLDLNFGDVQIAAGDFINAWQDLGRNYLLRANLYRDPGSLSEVTSNSVHKDFIFSGHNVTGRQLLDAFVSNYSDYTYTQDRVSGVIWIHPKNVHYDDILNQNVRINANAWQVPMLTGVLTPLCAALAPEVMVAMPAWWGFSPRYYFDYYVDLPAGDYTARDILNYCCAQNISKSFVAGPRRAGNSGAWPVDLDHDTQKSTTRTAAVNFWRTEIGPCGNEGPKLEQIGAVMADADPHRRWAAQTYSEAAMPFNRLSNLAATNDGPERMLWIGLGLDATFWRGDNCGVYLRAVAGGITNDLAEIKDPPVALLLSMVLAAQERHSDYLNGIIKDHKFTESEIAKVTPEIYRIARQSGPALLKLKVIEPDLPPSSQLALDKLEQTNLFTRLPAEDK